MSRVSSNNCALRYVVETSLGVPATSGWKLTEPNGIGTFGSELSTVARRPISTKRGRRKGAVTGLTSAVDFEGDLTMASFEDFAEGFVFAEFANTEFTLRGTGSVVPPPAATGTTFTVAAASALLAGKVQYSAAHATLLWAKGYTNAANNGLHVLTADLAAAGTTITVGGSSLVAETPPTNASLDVTGMRFAAGELNFVVTGSYPTQTAVITFATVDPSTLGILPGQYIHVGSPNPSTFEPQNGFDPGQIGYARVTAVTSTTISLDKMSATLDTTDASNLGNVDILFGRFLRNVEVEADADDERYLERSFTFEVVYPDLGGVGTDEYEYAKGNFANELTINIPLEEKVTASWAFVGTDTDAITSSRRTGASGALTPIRTTAIGTSSNIRLSTDVVGDGACFKDLTLTIRNNMTPENCLGVLGASYVNAGLFEVALEGQMLFTDKAIVNAIRDNETVTFSAALEAAGDGAVVFDLPALTFGGGQREFPVDASVLVSITGESYTDETFGHDIGISLFPVIPTY